MSAPPRNESSKVQTLECRPTPLSSFQLSLAGIELYGQDMDMFQLTNISCSNCQELWSLDIFPKNLNSRRSGLVSCCNMLLVLLSSSTECCLLSHWTMATTGMSLVGPRRY